MAILSFMAVAPLLNSSGFVVATMLDVLMVVLVFLNVIRGRLIGLLPLLLFDIGFFSGMYVGVLLVPYTTIATNDRSLRAVLTLLTVLGVGVFFGHVAQRIGLDNAYIFDKVPKLKTPVDLAGAVWSGATSIILVWLVSGMILTSQGGWLVAGLERSFVLRLITSIAPPVPSVISHVQTFIDPNGSPQVFVGLEPIPSGSAGAADQTVVDAAVKLDAMSVVRVDGLGCGGLVTGSGFVVAPGTVMTAAHVVAGLKHPVVIDSNGIHSATVILFDSQMDIALLRASHLAGMPLALSATKIIEGTKAVALGYPDGGSFAPTAAGIIELSEVEGYDIYGRGNVKRQLQSLESRIRPGNSGGPLVLADGSVAGMVIARSRLSENVGYALSEGSFRSAVLSATNRHSEVGTGSCTEPY